MADQDLDAILRCVEDVKSLPDWKTGSNIYNAYEVCFDIQKANIKSAIDNEDMQEIQAALKSSELLDTLPLLNAEVCQQVKVVCQDAVRILCEDAVKPLVEAMTGEPSAWDADTIKDALQDERLTGKRQRELMPGHVAQVLDQAEQWLKSTAPTPISNT